MRRFDYLEVFFKKHNLSGKITVKYDGVENDEYMSDVILENGVTININDIIFDIDTDLPADVVEMWMDVKKDKDISLPEWIQTDIHYLPNSLDTSSVEAYQRELNSLFDNVKDVINEKFKFVPEDEGDSESEE